MFKKKTQRTGPIEIDLTGPDGNAFMLLAYAKLWSDQIGLDWEEIETDMTSSDYDHLLSVMEKHFGSFVVFYK